jgi:hypothetical protein
MKTCDNCERPEAPIEVSVGDEKLYFCDSKCKKEYQEPFTDGRYK